MYTYVYDQHLVLYQIQIFARNIRKNPGYDIPTLLYDVEFIFWTFKNNRNT